MKTQTKGSQALMTPEDIIQLLKEGNRRFQRNLKADRNLIEQVSETSTGQFPYAVILSCIDSRVSAELIFDQGIGDVFSARVAGNFINEDILGSMEFGCKLAGSKLIVVMGHSSCGAIKGACDNVQLGNLTSLISKLKPAVEAIKESGEIRNSSNSNFVEQVARKNVELTIQNIKNQSPVLKEMADTSEIKIVGAYYSVKDGRVEFFD